LCAMIPRKRAKSSAGRMRAFSSMSERLPQAVSTWAGEYEEPSRVQATRCALGATAAVGSSCRNVSRRTVSSRSLGLSAARSWARTATRRAWSLVSSCTAMTRP
jgi:hypothetical protein